MKANEPSTAQVSPVRACALQGGCATREHGTVVAQPRPGASWRPGRRGFALVVTLSLMILLTILAVGLLSLSAVSLRNTTQAQDQQTARANARLAMMIAIGELQKTLGPDQRVSAPADLAHPSATMPHWVGVYGNKEKANYADAPGTVAYGPTLLNWLVSGNEGTGFAFSKSAADFGKITGTPGSNPFKPTDAVANIASATAWSSDLRINNTKAALLVGTNSAGPYDPTQNPFVAAPVVATKNGSNQVTGGYAYWVGDEGTKARINLQDNYRQQTATAATNTAKAYSFVSQRSGIEVMRRDLTKTSSIGADYDPSSAKINHLVTTGQLPLLNSSTLPSVAKYRFHDLTAYSSGVLADCYAGGLKRNLSAAIQTSATTPAGAEPIFTPVRANDFGLPTWGMLRSWTQLTASRNSPANPAAIAPRPYDPASKLAGFGPVISMCGLGLGLERVGANQLQLQYYPALVMWNPHAAPIAAASYELGIAARNGGTIQVNLTNDGANWDTWESFSLADGGASNLNPTPVLPGNGFFRFRVEGSIIPPGESHIYTIKPADNQTPYNPGVSTLTRAALTSGVVGNETRYLTGRPFTFVPQLYTDAVKAQVHLNSIKTTMSQDLTTGVRLEAVLTEPGGLNGGFTASTRVYQAVLDACVRRQLANNGNWEYQNLNANPNLGYHQIFALRTQMGMENHHVNSTGSDIGMLATPGLVSFEFQQANRWIATSNPLAPYTKRTKAEKGFTGGNTVHGGVLANRDIASTSMNLFMWTSGTPVYRSAIGLDQSPKGNEPVDAILRDVLPNDLPLLSLGQLQHAPFSVYGFTPTYCFGNSKIDMRIRDRSQSYLPSFVAPPGAAPTDYTDTLYDLPWHLNRALWDRYFVSSVPEDLKQADIDSANPLPNARMTYVRRNGQAPALGDLLSGNANSMTRAAADLMVAGGFNINSTSVDAWRAVLTGTNKVEPSSEFANPTYQATTGLNAPIARFARDVRTTDSTDPTGVLNMWDVATRYLGNRELVLLASAETPDSAAQRLVGVAGELAEKIVAEVRARGPFLSLADFINRDLVAGDKGLRGALQAAIDKCQPSNEVNPTGTYSNAYKGLLAPTGKLVTDYDMEAYLGGPLSDVSSPTDDNIAYRNRYDQSSKLLTQADVLTTLGPTLSARSDTFVIRGYGEATTASGARTAAAWCEAVIQRTPDYVDPADGATVAPGLLTSELNKTFGRSLKIISFRWLSANEI